MINKTIIIGNCSIPKHRFGLLLEQTQKLYNKYHLEETNSEAIAATLDYTRRSNPFYAHLNDFISFGLLEGEGRSGYRVTELGKKAIQQDSVRRQEALEELIRNIPLWDRLLNEYGTKVDKATFSQRLAAITGAEPAEIQKRAEKIRRAYLDDIEYIKPTEASARLPASQQGSSSRQESFTIAISREAAGYILFPEYHTSIEIKDDISYNLAKQLLEAIGKKLGVVEEQRH